MKTKKKNKKTKSKSKRRCLICRTHADAKTKNFCGSVPGKQTKCFYVPLQLHKTKQNWNWCGV